MTKQVEQYPQKGRSIEGKDIVPELERGLFEGITNRSMIDELNQPIIRIRDGQKLYDLLIADESLLASVKQFCDQIFGVGKTTSEAALRSVINAGKICVAFDEDGQVVGVTQVVTAADNEAVCCGTAVAPDYRGSQVARVLYKAQEVVAREQHKEKLSARVGIKNFSSIRSRLNAGFRIVGYGHTQLPEGHTPLAELIMEKDLINEPLPFMSQEMAKRLEQGKIRVLFAGRPNITWTEVEIAIPVDSSMVTDTNAHALLEQAFANGYIGTGLLAPQEVSEGAVQQSYFILQKREHGTIVESLRQSVHLPNEYAPLRQVIVVNPQFNAQISRRQAINAVAAKNVENVDSLAFREEYDAFVKTLEDAGVEVVRSGVRGTEGKSPVFTRDPGFAMGDIFVVGKLFREQRQYESRCFLELVQNIPHFDFSQETEAALEGGDVIMLDDGLVLVGLGQRTNQQGLDKLAKAFPNYTFMGVPHEDLHLDVLFVALGKKKVLADITKLPTEFIAKIKSLGYEVVVADPVEQESLGCNVVALDDHKVIAAANNVKTIAAMRQAGVEVVEVNMPNIIKKGGGPRCITCPTIRG